MAVTATFAQIRAGLVSNLRSLGIQSTGYALASPTAPTIEVMPSGVAYDRAMGRGMDALTFTVRVTVAVTLDVPAQQTLDTYLAPAGAQSVKTMIESDQTLGGVVQSLHVTEASGYEFRDTNEGSIALSASWTVQVYA